MRQAGFTLIELLVVVIITGVLTSIALPQYRKAMDRAKVAEATQLLPAIFEARERWMIENGCSWAPAMTIVNCGERYPTFEELDIETKGSVDEHGVLYTKNFEYSMRAGSLVPPCVAARPAFGENRNLNSAELYYNGGNFVCSGDETACERLNFDYAQGACQ